MQAPPPASAAMPPPLHADVDGILSFWFAGEAPFKRWFIKDPAWDGAIRRQFSAAMAAAARGDLDGWQNNPRACLALLILLDQFPRNVYRNDAQAFASGAKGLQVATRAIAAGLDRKLPWLQQMFFYLPLEHDESLVSQVASVALIEGHAARAGAGEKELAALLVDYARRHRATIAALGRFPQRNVALQRAGRAADDAYLHDHPDGF